MWVKTFAKKEGKEGFLGYIRDGSPCGCQSIMTFGKPLFSSYTKDSWQAYQRAVFSALGFEATFSRSS
jgi:hypothetical protein